MWCLPTAEVIEFQLQQKIRTLTSSSVVAVSLEVLVLSSNVRIFGAWMEARDMMITMMVALTEPTRNYSMISILP